MTGISDRSELTVAELDITTEMVARTMGIKMLSPAVKSLWGIDASSGAQTDGIDVFDDHPTPLPSDLDIPSAVDHGTHSGINKKTAALRELAA